MDLQGGGDGCLPRVLVLADSHGRSLWSPLRFVAGRRMQLTVFFKPNATLAAVAKDVEGLTAGFTHQDAVVVIGGTNDLRQDCRVGAVSVVETAKSLLRVSGRTRLVLATLPSRYDVRTHDRHIERVNGSLREMAKAAGLEVLELAGLARKLYTRGGVHLNVRGKVVLCLRLCARLGLSTPCHASEDRLARFLDDRSLPRDDAARPSIAYSVCQLTLRLHQLTIRPVGAKRDHKHRKTRTKHSGDAKTQQVEKATANQSDTLKGTSCFVQPVQHSFETAYCVQSDQMVYYGHPFQMADYSQIFPVANYGPFGTWIGGEYVQIDSSEPFFEAPNIYQTIAPCPVNNSGSVDPASAREVPVKVNKDKKSPQHKRRNTKKFHKPKKQRLKPPSQQQELGCTTSAASKTSEVQQAKVPETAESSAASAETLSVHKQKITVDIVERIPK